MEGGVKAVNVVIGGSQTVHGNLTITVGTLPAASEAETAALEELLRQLTDMLNAVPAEHAEQALEVTLAAGDAVGELRADARIRASCVRVWPRSGAPRKGFKRSL